MTFDGSSASGRWLTRTVTRSRPRVEALPSASTFTSYQSWSSGGLVADRCVGSSGGADLNVQLVCACWLTGNTSGQRRQLLDGPPADDRDGR